MELRVDRAELLTELVPMQGIVERQDHDPGALAPPAHRPRRAAPARGHRPRRLAHLVVPEATSRRRAAIAVQAKKFLEIVRSLPEAEVQLVQEDPKILTIKAGTLPLQAPRPGARGLPDPARGVDRQPARDAVPALSPHDLEGPVRGVGRGVALPAQRRAAKLEKDGSFEMVATDGHRLALVEVAHDQAKKKDGVLVPRKALQELQRLEGDEPLAVPPRRAPPLVPARPARADLPHPRGHLPRLRAGDRQGQRQEGGLRRASSLAQTVQRVALLTGDRARAVRLEFSADLLVVSAANPDLGEAVEELGCDYAGRRAQARAQPRLPRRTSSAAVDTEKVRLELKDENSQCVGYPVEGEDKRYLCVIMPMRI